MRLSEATCKLVLCKSTFCQDRLRTNIANETFEQVKQECQFSRDAHRWRETSLYLNVDLADFRRAGGAEAAGADAAHHLGGESLRGVV